MNETSEHPARQLLAAYENGEFDDQQAELVERHLRTCPSCQSLIDRIREEDYDSRLLRAAFVKSGSEPSSSPGEPGNGATAAPAADSKALVLNGSGEGQPPKTGLARARDRRSDSWDVPDYERIRLCGEGAYGSVWAVRDRVGVYRALKIIDFEKINHSNIGGREHGALETYCRQVGRQPYLITVFHVGVMGDRLYYTMELADDDRTKAPVSGTFPTGYRPLTLATVMRRQRIPPEASLEIARRLLQGLDRLHTLGLVHRDIKPANIVFVDRIPKLADIGMITEHDRMNEGLGTPSYMPPDGVMDKTGDTYAMGKVLHEMIAGKASDSFPELPSEYLIAGPKWAMEKVNHVIMRACSAHAHERYASASEMLDQLESCAGGSFHSLFDELDDDEAVASSDPGQVERTRVLIAAMNAVPWVMGLAAGTIILLKIISILEKYLLQGS